MKPTFNIVKKLRRLNHIHRCSLYPVLKPTSVAEHSWHVSVLVACVCQELISNGWTIRTEKVVMASIFHDAEESIISDIPYPVKRRVKRAVNDILHELFEFDMPEAPGWLSCLILNITDLTELELKVLKTCDMAELVMYARDEYNMGNRKILPLLIRGIRELVQLNVSVGSKLIDSIANAGEVEELEEDNE